MTKEYQVILYGATGFTGRLCAEYFNSNYPDLSWAIAGRNEEKLKTLSEELNLNCDIDVADSEDYEAIKSFVKKNKGCFICSRTVCTLQCKGCRSMCRMQNSLHRHNWRKSLGKRIDRSFS